MSASDVAALVFAGIGALMCIVLVVDGIRYAITRKSFLADLQRRYFGQ